MMNDPMGDDPMMNDPMGGDPNAMGDDPMMNDPMGGDPNAMGGTGNPKLDNIQNMLGQLSDDDMKAAEGYIESLLSDNDSDNDGVNDSNEIDNPNAMGGDPNSQQMQEAFMREFNNLALYGRQNKRDLKKIPTNMSIKNPFISNRE